ncbi:MAG: ABC transporter ATP-binding protein [Bacteroidia bacterium]|nr:ABC transporter ATP-binding protein [Bacteroidia bacterium]
MAFSGISAFLDTPIKYYSSGMYVRLAFSVAAHLRTDILFVDEVLAVGDAEFREKSLNKMHQSSQSGKTILFISHDLATINQLCPKAMLLER